MTLNPITFLSHYTPDNDALAAAAKFPVVGANAAASMPPARPASFRRPRLFGRLESCCKNQCYLVYPLKAKSPNTLGGVMEIVLRRVELYRKVWLEPMGQLSCKLDIPSAKLREVCKTMTIPVPPLGYWNAIRAGKTIVPTPFLGDGACSASAKANAIYHQLLPAARTWRC